MVPWMDFCSPDKTAVLDCNSLVDEADDLGENLIGLTPLEYTVWVCELKLKGGCGPDMAWIAGTTLWSWGLFARASVQEGEDEIAG